MKKIWLPGVLVVSMSASLSAQTFNELATYLALIRTPIGGLPPVATSTILGDVQNGAALALRYGHIASGPNFPDFNNFGVTGVLPAGTSSTISLTGGVSTGSGNTSSALMLSIGGDTRLTDMPFSMSRTSPRLRVGLNGELGYGKPSSASLIAGSVGLPLSIVHPARRDEMQIVPFLTPAFGFGNFDPEDDRIDTQSGAHFMIGGGIALFNRSSGVAINFGFQYVAVSNSSTLLGLVLTLGGR